MHKEDKNDSLIGEIIFLIVGIALVGAGIYFTIQKIRYEEAPGKYTYSTSYMTKDDEGNVKIKYKWYYDYYVDDYKFVGEFAEQDWEIPSKKKDIILYDPDNPNKVILKSDRRNIMIIIMGLFFASLPFVSGKSNEGQKKKSNLSVASIWLTYSVAIFLVFFLSVDFDFKELINHYLFPTIVLGIFVFLGIFLLVDALKSQKK